MFIYREIGLAELWQILVSSVYLIAQILIIVTGAGVYSYLMTTSGIPQHVIDQVSVRVLRRAQHQVLAFLYLDKAGVARNHACDKVDDPVQHQR